MIAHRAMLAAALIAAAGCDFTPLHGHYRCVQHDWLHVDAAPSAGAAREGLLLEIHADRTWRMVPFKGEPAAAGPGAADAGTWSLSGRRLILRQSPPAELFAGYIYEIVSCEEGSLRLVIAGETVEFRATGHGSDSHPLRTER